MEVRAKRRIFWRFGNLGDRTLLFRQVARDFQTHPTSLLAMQGSWLGLVTDQQDTLGNLPRMHGFKRIMPLFQPPRAADDFFCRQRATC